MIFRNDDVSQNTDIGRMAGCYKVLSDYYPNAEIWSAVSILSRENRIGSVYPNVPFKDKHTEWFYDVDQAMVFNNKSFGEVFKNGTLKIVSHGLLHFDHSKVSSDLQAMSILTSCTMLRTNIFVPPFNRFNEDTERVCLKYNVHLVGKAEKWLNLESNDFDPKHKHWYFHSWRLGPDKLRDIIDNGIRKHKENRAVLG